jgi:hypothetical protein
MEFLLLAENPRRIQQKQAGRSDKHKMWFEETTEAFEDCKRGGGQQGKSNKFLMADA